MYAESPLGDQKSMGLRSFVDCLVRIRTRLLVFNTDGRKTDRSGSRIPAHQPEALARACGAVPSLTLRVGVGTPARTPTVLRMDRLRLWKQPEGCTPATELQHQPPSRPPPIVAMLPVGTPEALKFCTASWPETSTNSTDRPPMNLPPTAKLAVVLATAGRE